MAAMAIGLLGGCGEKPYVGDSPYGRWLNEEELVPTVAAAVFPAKDGMAWIQTIARYNAEHQRRR